MKRSLLWFLCVPLWVFAYPLTPQVDATPGGLCNESDPDLSEYRYDEQIPYCQRKVSAGLKKNIYREYAIPEAEQTQYTIDHFFPLSLGGSNRKENLWPEHREVKATRPRLEIELYVALRDGSLHQDEALEIIREVKLNPCSESVGRFLTPVLEHRDACRRQNPPVPGVKPIELRD